MSDTRKDLPSTNAANFQQRLRETVMTFLGRQGAPLDRAVTLRDLVDNGIVKLGVGWRPGGSSVPPLVPGSSIEAGYEKDLTPPPTPTKFVVSAAISHVFIEHDAPIYRQGHGHKQTRVYGVTVQAGDPTPTFSNAVEVGQFTGQVWAMPTNPSTTWHLWIKWETNDGVLSVSPAGGTNGLVVKTGEDVGLLLDALTGKITESQLYQDLNERIDLIDGNAIGSVNVRIQDAFLSEVEIRAAADELLNTQVGQETTNRISALLEEYNARSLADGVISDAIQFVGNEATLTTQALLEERDARTIAEAAITQALQATAIDLEQEVLSRSEAISAEVQARNDAIAAEAGLRQEQITLESKQRIEATQATAEATLRSIIASANERIDREKEVASAKQELKTGFEAGILAEASARLELTAVVNKNVADIVSEQVVRSTADAAMASDITALTAQVNNNAAVIRSESIARTEADAAEAAQRNLLATQFRGDYTGGDINSITEGLLYQERIARSSQDEALALQITLLSAGAGEQFDWSAIWYFDGGAENWTGNGTPTVSQGWLRPANQASAAYVESPSGIGSDGNKYGQVRLRIRKVGSPVFSGYLWWRTATDTTWDASRRVSLAEPTFDANGIGLITAAPTWAVFVDRLRVDLSSAQTATDYFEIDWVAIGRPSPGASAAQLLEEQEARAKEDEALARNLTYLSAKIGDSTAALTTEVSTRSTADSALSTSFASLSAGVDRNAASILYEQTARADAASALSSSLLALEANTENASAAIYAEQTARAQADSSIAESMTGLVSTVGNMNADLLVVQQTVADLDSAMTTTSTTQVASNKRNAESADRLAEATLRDVIAINMERTSREETLAVARQELTTKIEDGLLAEAEARQLLSVAVADNAAAILEEQIARATQDEAIAQDLTGLIAQTGIASVAAINEERTARTTADEANSNAVIALSVDFAESSAALTVEQLARSDADSSTASQLVSLVATTENNAAAINLEQQVRSDASSALASQMAGLAALTANSAAAITGEQTARAQADSAISESVIGLSSSVGNLSAVLTTVQQAVVELDSVVVSSTSTLVAASKQSEKNNDQLAEAALRDVLAINTEREIREETVGFARQELTTKIEEGLLAEAKARLLLTATVNENTAGILDEQTVRATADEAITTNLTALISQTGLNASAAITDEQTTRTDVDSALASQVTEIAVLTATGAAALTVEQQTRADETSASASQVAALAANTGANAAALTIERQARTGNDEAAALQTTSLAAQIGEGQSAIKAEQQARIDSDSSLASQAIALVTQSGSNVAALTVEQQVRSDSVSAISFQTASLAVTTGANTAALKADQQAFSDDAEAVSGQISALSVQSGANQSTIAIEQKARTTADESNAVQAQTIGVSVQGNTAGLIAEKTARVSENAALASNVNSLAAAVGSNAAAIQLEQSVRSGETESLANQILTLTASVDFDAAVTWVGSDISENWPASTAQNDPYISSPAISIDGSVYRVIRSRVKRTGGSGWQGTAYYATPGHNYSSSYRKTIPDSTVFGEWRILEWDMSQLTSGEADWTSSTITRIRIDLGTSDVDSFEFDWISVGRTAPAGTAAVQQEAAARSAADEAEAQSRLALAARVTTAEGAITTSQSAISTEQTTRANADSALASYTSTLAATVNGNYNSLSAALQNEATARANADTAEAQARQTLQSTVESNNAALNAAIQTEAATRASADTVEAQARQTLQAIVDSNNTTLTAAIQVEAETRASQTGELYSKYGVKLDVNGYVTGWAMNNNGSTGDMIVLADKFVVGAPGGGNITPFIVNTTEQVINGVTVPVGAYMDAAYIKNGTITNAKIANLAVDSAKIADLSADKITSGEIAVGHEIKSSGFIANSGSTAGTGWRIGGNGNAEFNNATVRGTVYATNGQFWGTLLGGAATAYNAGLGFYAGGGSTTNGDNYRWRVGNPTGARIQWTGSAVEVYNANNQLTLTSGGITASQVSGLGTLATQNGVTASQVSGLGALATQNGVSTSQVSGLGSLATQSSVSTSQVTGLGTLATKNSVDWKTQLTNIPAFGNFAYLSSITSANISTYIASAAIGEAYIAGAAITTAKINDAAITSAKIGDSQVNTLKIAGNSVFAATRGTMSGSASYPSAGSNSDVVGYIYPGITKNHSGSVIFIVTAVVYGNSGGGDIWAKVYRSDGTLVGQDTAYASVMREWAFSYAWTFIDTSPVEGSGYRLNMGISRGGSITVLRADMVAISGKR